MSVLYLCLPIHGSLVFHRLYIILFFSFLKMTMDVTTALNRILVEDLSQPKRTHHPMSRYRTKFLHSNNPEQGPSSHTQNGSILGKTYLRLSAM